MAPFVSKIGGEAITNQGQENEMSSVEGLQNSHTFAFFPIFY